MNGRTRMDGLDEGITQPSLRKPDAEWLSTILGTEISIDQETDIGASRGFLSTTWRLKLSSSSTEFIPTSLVLKSQSSNPLFSKIAHERRSFEREIAFYRELAPSVSARVPNIIAVGDYHDPWLLMEDLTHLRAGDQIKGLSQREVRAVVREIASVHASFWQDQKLIKIAWLPVNSFWFSEVDNTIVDAFIEEYGRRIGDRMVTVLKAVLEQLPLIDQALATRPFTLVHGDLRADNILLEGSEDNPDAVILDWQTTCRSLGAIDLAYLIGGSEPEAERSSHIRESLYLWHGELVANGVHDYSINDARRDFQLGSLRCLAVTVRLYSTLHHQNTSVRGALYRDETIARYFDLAESIEAWEALPSPLTDCHLA
jgi:thiamine kinase-like enzyme